MIIMIIINSVIKLHNNDNDDIIDHTLICLHCTLFLLPHGIALNANLEDSVKFTLDLSKLSLSGGSWIH